MLEWGYIDENLATPCKGEDYFFYTPQTDNIKFVFLALDCDYVHTYFAAETQETKDHIKTVCVDVADGKKA